MTRGQNVGISPMTIGGKNSRRRKETGKWRRVGWFPEITEKRKETVPKRANIERWKKRCSGYIYSEV